jgi:hypothetical protein
MKFVYNSTWLHNLHLVKEAKRWMKHGWISKDQFAKISGEYTSSFYHPNLFIRILLFIATLIALAGISGLFGLMLVESEKTSISILCLLYGIGSWIFLEKIFIQNSNHYKSGVSEALLYHSIGFMIGGVIGLTDGNVTLSLIFAVLLFGFSSIRFIDLISTLCVLCCFAGLLFYWFYEADGIFRSVIPFALIFSFSGLYFFLLKLKKKTGTESWEDCFLISEAFCLLIIYAAGNYLVVRELSISMMGLAMEEGEDIPFAFLFYFLTVAIPVIYLYFGIKKKDGVMIRVSLVALAFAVFTFKYYFSLGHHEITLTAGGIILIAIALGLFRYLKTPRNGYTAENILSERWGNANLSAFVISQTMGGNKAPEHPEEMGGSFSGGGSTESF